MLTQTRWNIALLASVLSLLGGVFSVIFGLGHVRGDTWHYLIVLTRTVGVLIGMSGLILGKWYPWIYKSATGRAATPDNAPMRRRFAILTYIGVSIIMLSFALFCLEVLTIIEKCGCARQVLF